MIEMIIETTNESKKCLKEIVRFPKNEWNEKTVKPLLKKAVCCKLMISEDETDDIRKLIILSIKSRNKEDASLPDQVIQSKIEKYDCHQSNLVTQKKTLLILFIEKELGIHFTDEDAVEIASIDDLCRMVIKYGKMGEEYGTTGDTQQVPCFQSE